MHGAGAGIWTGLHDGYFAGQVPKETGGHQRQNVRSADKGVVGRGSTALEL